MSDGSPLIVSSTATSPGLTRDNNRSPVIIIIDDEYHGGLSITRLKYTRFPVCSSSVSSGRSWVREGWLLYLLVDTVPSRHCQLRIPLFAWSQNWNNLIEYLIPRVTTGPEHCSCILRYY